MKNKEFYKDQLAEIAVQGGVVAKVNNKLVVCNTTRCKDCDWYNVPGGCVNRIKEWTEEEYKFEQTYERIDEEYAENDD